MPTPRALLTSVPRSLLPLPIHKTSSLIITSPLAASSQLAPHATFCSARFQHNDARPTSNPRLPTIISRPSVPQHAHNEFLRRSTKSIADWWWNSNTLSPGDRKWWRYIKRLNRTHSVLERFFDYQAQSFETRLRKHGYQVAMSVEAMGYIVGVAVGLALLATTMIMWQLMQILAFKWFAETVFPRRRKKRSGTAGEIDSGTEESDGDGAQDGDIDDATNGAQAEEVW